jgi:hypothetical protein
VCVYILKYLLKHDSKVDTHCYSVVRKEFVLQGECVALI